MDELENKAGIQAALKLLKELSDVERDIFWQVYAQILRASSEESEVSEPQ